MVFHILGDRTLMQNLHADGLYHEPASKCNFDLNRQNTLLLNLFGTIGRKNTTLDGMYHMLLVTVYSFMASERSTSVQGGGIFHPLPYKTPPTGHFMEKKLYRNFHGDILT